MTIQKNKVAIQSTDITNKQNIHLVPLTLWEKYFVDPSVNSLRWLVFKNPNDFKKHCIVRRGKRILIDVEGYFSWLRDNQDETVKKC